VHTEAQVPPYNSILALERIINGDTLAAHLQSIIHDTPDQSIGVCSWWQLEEWSNGECTIFQ